MLLPRRPLRVSLSRRLTRSTTFQERQWAPDRMQLLGQIGLLVVPETAKRQEAVIAGFTVRRRTRPCFGALVLAIRDNDAATSARWGPDAATRAWSNSTANWYSSSAPHRRSPPA